MSKFREANEEKNIFSTLETFFLVKLPLGEIFQIVYTGTFSIIQTASFVGQSKSLIENKSLVSTLTYRTQNHKSIQ